MSRPVSVTGPQSEMHKVIPQFVYDSKLVQHVLQFARTLAALFLRFHKSANTGDAIIDAQGRENRLSKNGIKFGLLNCDEEQIALTH